jgi:hypothetical protein
MSEMIDSTAMSVLASGPRVLTALFAGVTDDAASDARDDGWSAKDALAHVLDVEQGVISTRIRRILDEQRPFIRSIDAPARLIEGGYAARSVSSLLDELAAARERHVAWLQTLTADQLARAGDHDEAGEITASDIAHQWAYHDLMHIKQVASMLQAGLVGHMGNTRKFYDV